MKSFYKHGVKFQKIEEQLFKQINISDLKFLIISRSGGIDAPGNIYFFTSKNAFFMDKNGYGKNFINKLLSKIPDWHKINLYFCDDLIISPAIYDSFVHELCKRNNRAFWFQTTIEIFNDWYLK